MAQTELQAVLSAGSGGESPTALELQIKADQVKEKEGRCAALASVERASRPRLKRGCGRQGG